MSSVKTMNLFFYGSLMGKFPRSRGPKTGATYLKEAQVAGTMYDAHYYPAIRLGGDNIVKGELWRVDNPAIISALDEYEGYVEEMPEGSLFKRVTTTTIDGEECIVYEFNKGLGGAVKVDSGDWFSHTSGINRM